MAPVDVSAPTRILWILRHAKAASDAPWGGDDQQRPLTARGRRDAAALGKRLATDPVDLDLVAGGVPPPELALCSAAVRTRQTTDLVAEGMGGLPVDAYHSLYGADPDLLFQYVREIDESATSALVVGHNPTVFEAAWRLLAEPTDTDGADAAVGDGLPRSDRTRLEAHGFPTCALAVLVLHVGAWEDVTEGIATLAGVFKPPY